jgi:hypothetical protein
VGVTAKTSPRTKSNCPVGPLSPCESTKDRRAIWSSAWSGKQSQKMFKLEFASHEVWKQAIWCILWCSKFIVENSCSVADSTRQSCDFLHCHVLVLYFSGHVFVRSISWPSHVVNLSTFGRQQVDSLHETRRALHIGLEETFLGCSGLWWVKNWCS